MSNQPLVAVVGASGFIGTRLVEWLILHDVAKVRPIVRSFKSMARLARFDLDSRVANATDRLALAEQMRGCEVVFYCVAGGRDTILKSTEATYLAAARTGVRRVVYISSAVVHGHDPLPGTHDDSELISRQPFEYNVSRVMAEYLLRRLRTDGAVEVVVLRPLIVFGPRSMWWTAQIAADLLDKKAFLIDGGKWICNTVYVDNLVQAMWLAVISQEARNQDFIITDGERVTWHDLYSAVAEATGVEIAAIPCIESAALTTIYREQRRSQLRDVVCRSVTMAVELLPTDFIGVAKKILPSRAATALKRHLTASRETRLVSNELGNGHKTLPFIDPELASLQRCRYVLPIGKAQRLLGYVPQISFAEGCRRTREWIRFAFGIGFRSE